MTTGSSARRFAPSVVVALLGLSLAAGAMAMDQPSRPDSIARPDRAVETEVLTQRRVPELLAEPLGQERLGRELSPVVAAMPEASCLVVAVEGRPVFTHNPDMVLVPASNQKLLTAHAALAELGPDHVWKTTASAVAAPIGGILGSDLWIVGGGDPVVTTLDFAPWFAGTEPPTTSLEDLADQIVAAGVDRVDGRILADLSRYDGETRVEDWPRRNLGNSEVGPLSPLLVNRGYSRFPSSPDDETTRVATTSDPGRHAAGILDDLLEERGVVVRGSPGTGEAPEGAVVLGELTSPPASAVIGWMLSGSDNTIAELMLKELAFARTGVGSTSEGTKVVVEHVLEAVGESPGLVVADGSGIHDDNRVSCATIRKLLDVAPEGSPLRESLPVAGRSGTLRGRFLDTLVVDRLRAKTGWLNEAAALSGYVNSLSGFELSFSWIVNESRVTDETVALQDQLASAMVRYPADINVEELAPVGALSRGDEQASPEANEGPNPGVGATVTSGAITTVQSDDGAPE